MKCKCGSSWECVCPTCHQWAPIDKWIRTQDRLPKKGEYEEILTFQMIEDNRTGKMLPHISIDPRENLYIRKGRLYSDFGNEEVTHWQPPPEPPK
jgi:hypothetical protein